MAIEALKEAFSFKEGPKSLLAEVIGFVFITVVLLGAAYFIGDYGVVLGVLGGCVAATAGRYIWWHFRPYKKPEPQPMTRYTNPRYTKNP